MWYWQRIGFRTFDLRRPREFFAFLLSYSLGWLKI